MTMTDMSTERKNMPVNTPLDENYIRFMSKRCEKHGPLPEIAAEGLLKLGFAFKSAEAFHEYCARNAKNWYFYYSRSDTRNVKTSVNYNPKRASYMQFSCIFHKKHYKSKGKGIRKRK